MHKKVTQNILALKIVEQIWPGMYSYELNKLFLDIFRSGYSPAKGLMRSAYKLVHADMTAGYKNFDRSIKLFRKNFYNDQEVKCLQKMSENCELCIKAKATPKQVPIGKYSISKKTFTTIGSDILGPLRTTAEENKYVLIFRDFTTRYSIFKALPNILIQSSKL